MSNNYSFVKISLTYIAYYEIPNTTITDKLETNSQYLPVETAIPSKEHKSV